MSRFVRRLMIVIAWITLLSLLPANESMAAGRVQKTGSKIIVVIDPGHGGDENTGTTEGGVAEKEMTLVTAFAMAEELRLFDGIEVYLTRAEDRDLSLKERAKVAANLNADFLISLHYNASESHSLYGAEAWISLSPDFHAQGYQLATEFLREFRDMGLTLRGIKTKRHSKGNDYYGILRESVSLGVPAILVEHCHVDHAMDQDFCDSKEDFEAFGKADARAVAKYFGLKSSSLGIDYSAEAANLPEVTAGEMVPRAMQDKTNPQYCKIELVEAKYKEDLVAIKISAADPESNLIYYAYSFDDGISFCKDLPWPEGDLLTGEFSGEFVVTLEVPDNTRPRIRFRATNPYDLQCVSECIAFDQFFKKPEMASADQSGYVDATDKLLPKPQEEESSNTFDVIIRYLRIGIVIVVLALAISMAILFLKNHKNDLDANKNTSETDKTKRRKGNK